MYPASLFQGETNIKRFYGFLTIFGCLLYLYHTWVLTIPRQQLALLTVSPASVRGGSHITGTVTLLGLDKFGGQRIYFTHDKGPVSTPAYVDVPPTTGQITFPITTSGVSARQVIHIYASLGNQAVATLTITP